MMNFLPDRCYQFLYFAGSSDPFPLQVDPIRFLNWLQLKAPGNLLQFQTFSGDDSGFHPVQVLACKRSDLSDRIIIGRCPLSVALNYTSADRIVRLPDGYT